MTEPIPAKPPPPDDLERATDLVTAVRDTLGEAGMGDMARALTKALRLLGAGGVCRRRGRREVA